MIFDKPITIQFLNEEKGEWEDLYKLHASINKARTDSEFIKAGAEQNKRFLTFSVMFFKNLSDVIMNTSCYRIVYNGVIYDIYDVDDFKEQHFVIKLTGGSNNNE